eukprot:269593-Rhodomonas_salina.1
MAGCVVGVRACDARGLQRAERGAHRVRCEIKGAHRVRCEIKHAKTTQSACYCLRFAAAAITHHRLILVTIWNSTSGELRLRRVDSAARARTRTVTGVTSATSKTALCGMRQKSMHSKALAGAVRDDDDGVLTDDDGVLTSER